MNSYRINANYAKALFLLATERGNPRGIADDMRLVSRVTSENRQLAALFANPTLKPGKKYEILKELFEDRVSDESMKFLHFVVKKNRTVHLRGIAEAYLDIYREHSGIVLSNLVTQQPIDDAARDAVTKLVAEYTGKQVELNDTTETRMLGGFKLDFDNNLYDARLRTKIRKLRIEFAKNDYEKKL